MKRGGEAGNEPGNSVVDQAETGEGRENHVPSDDC